MSTLPKSFITPEQYLEIDRQAERKSEYYDGEMFAMAGVGVAHNSIVWNLIASLNPHLRGRRCRGYPSDLRVRIAPDRRYSYPDVTVVCGEPEFLDEQRDVLPNPTLIVEVLSPSTASFDRGFKFDAYTAMESLREYVLVASDRASVEVFSRQLDGRWLLAKAIGTEASAALESVGCKLALADIYENVEFPPTSAHVRA
jgi:Uma2 family endonuclease